MGELKQKNMAIFNIKPFGLTKTIKNGGYIFQVLFFFSSSFLVYCLASLAVWWLLWLLGFCGFFVAPVTFWLLWLL